MGCTDLADLDVYVCVLIPYPLPSSYMYVLHFFKAGLAQVDFFLAWRKAERRDEKRHGRDGQGVNRCLWNRAGRQATRIE